MNCESKLFSLGELANTWLVAAVCMAHKSIFAVMLRPPRGQEGNCHDSCYPDEETEAMVKEVTNLFKAPQLSASHMIQ